MGKRDEIFGWYLSKLIYEWNPFKAKRKRNFYKQLIKKGDLCFDVGAHLGDRVSSWLDLGASVVAFEPQPKFSKYLAEKFKNKSGFHLENIGVSGSVGNMKFNVCERYPTLSSLQGKEWESQLNENSSLNIKFDTIHEKEVLKGLSQKVDCLSFEFLSFNKEDLNVCLEMCESLGYTNFNWSYQEEFKFRIKGWTSKAEILSDIGSMKKKVFSGDVYAKSI